MEQLVDATMQVVVILALAALASLSAWATNILRSWAKANMSAKDEERLDKAVANAASLWSTKLTELGHDLGTTQGRMVLVEQVQNYLGQHKADVVQRVAGKGYMLPAETVESRAIRFLGLEAGTGPRPSTPITPSVASVPPAPTSLPQAPLLRRHPAAVAGAMALALMLLNACSGQQGDAMQAVTTDTTWQSAMVCKAFGTGVQVATTARKAGQLNASQVGAIDQLIGEYSPHCIPKVDPNIWQQASALTAAFSAAGVQIVMPTASGQEPVATAKGAK